MSSQVGMFSFGTCTDIKYRHIIVNPTKLKGAVNTVLLWLKK